MLCLMKDRDEHITRWFQSKIGSRACRLKKEYYSVCYLLVIRYQMVFYLTRPEVRLMKSRIEFSYSFIFNSYWLKNLMVIRSSWKKTHSSRKWSALPRRASHGLSSAIHLYLYYNHRYTSVHQPDWLAVNLMNLAIKTELE